ncbi:MOSC domain-containing protein [Brevibacillus brevis]|uniref:MOSC domain-containing protein n=1 Tax=Brevibacillus brevis TaxID=1393 RepID=A0ABY9T6L4_BREBE|nr:MOSC domain-containing protein [Brevibacillus brevis]WNC15751.1 MOSC domain-containing protein [Brevibacillus brevis]
MKQVGKLGSVFRHPVKAMRGEKLASCRVDAFGLYGDRAYYFLDESRDGKYLSADVVPSLLGYSASMADESAGDSYPEVRITAQDGSVHTWGDSLFAHVEETAKRPIRPMRSTPAEGGKNWEDHVLLVTDASLREVARLIGWETIDPRRFRGNLVVALEEDVPFVEDSWIGKQIRIGEVVLQVNRHCERCMYVNIDPDTLQLHPAVLKTCVRVHDNHFGVYASVVTPGEIAEGDAVFVSE